MTKITARYEGPDGFLEDPDPATTTDDPIAMGGTFETTKSRLKQLQEQGLRVVEVDADKPAASAASTASKETGK